MVIDRPNAFVTVTEIWYLDCVNVLAGTVHVDDVELARMDAKSAHVLPYDGDNTMHFHLYDNALDESSA